MRELLKSAINITRPADISPTLTYMGNRKRNRKSEMGEDSAPASPDLTPEETARRAALPDAARRALAEADARARARAALPEGETGGPKGIEPTRYGDWERKGIAYDF
jgi:hypothetical protein